MHTVFSRRVLLPLSFLLLLYMLLVQPSHIRTDSSTESQEPLHIPNFRPFLNLSEPTSSNNHDFHDNSASSPPKLSSGPQAASTSSAWTNLLQLAQCPLSANRFTNHIRLPNTLYNISMAPSFSQSPETRRFWNPTIMSLPSWAENQYLVISMVLLKDMGYRQNVLCEANICQPKHQSEFMIGPICSEQDLEILGPNGGLRCATVPVEISIPWTPAEKCEGKEEALADIAGFHDPKVFYSGRGEPILMLSSQSRYACVGIWAIDLRKLYPTLESTFSSSPKRLGPGPLMSYPTLTELTRNPLETRLSYEKNWLMFSPTPGSTYLQYELTSAHRTFAKLIGRGFTTSNLTDPSEEPCLQDATSEQIAQYEYLASGTWHQATPALKLILCARTNLTCQAEFPETVFFAVIHRKHTNYLDLPIRYERYFVLWSTKPPFNMLAVSQYPILFANETTTGWTAEETWDDVPEAREERRGFWAKFSYTTTIAYAWRSDEGDVRDKGTGFLDDEVILSVGVDDIDQVYARVRVEQLLQCLRVCPGRL